MEYVIDGVEMFNEETGEFVDSPPRILSLDHTLTNLDKWESKHKKRLLGNKDISISEYREYVEISSGEDVSDVDDSTIVDIMNKLLTDTPSATVIPDGKRGKSGEREKIFTSEILYAYMYLYKIDNSWADKNINKFILLIQVMSELKNGPKKMSSQESAEEIRNLNKIRRDEARKRAAEMARRNKDGV